jgi:glycosyltransferase involved in cell wall biosynthesis
LARIGFDIRFCSDHFPGIGRVTYNVARALGEIAYGHELLLLHNRRLANHRFDISALAATPSIQFIELDLSPFAPANQWHVPLLARRLGLDLLHTPYYIAPYFGLPCPSVTTIYDIIGHHFPQYLSRQGQLLFEATTRLALLRSAAILTGSQSARSDLMTIYRANPTRLVVTPFGVEERFHPQSEEVVAKLKAKLRLNKRYVLYLGANKPHKNLERLLKAWGQLGKEWADLVAPWRLVLAGLGGGGEDATQHLVAEHGLQGVQLVPNVADEDLPALYSGADIFAFVSFYEGFGLPPLEAMACGTSVLCSHTSSLPEVVGNDALRVDPFSIDEITAGLVKLMSDDTAREQLRAAGLVRARAFTWHRTAQATLHVYEQLLHTNGNVLEGTQ